MYTSSTITPPCRFDCTSFFKLVVTDPPPAPSSSQVGGDYLLRVQYGQALLAVGRLAEALEAGRAAHALEPKRFEALVRLHMHFESVPLSDRHRPDWRLSCDLVTPYPPPHSSFSSYTRDVSHPLTYPPPCSYFSGGHGGCGRRPRGLPLGRRLPPPGPGHCGRLAG